MNQILEVIMTMAPVSSTTHLLTPHDLEESRVKAAECRMKICLIVCLIAYEALTLAAAITSSVFLAKINQDKVHVSHEAHTLIKVATAAAWGCFAAPCYLLACANCK